MVNETSFLTVKVFIMRQQSLAILNSELWTFNFFFLEKRISSKYQFRLLYCWGNTFTGRAHHTWANNWPNEEAGEWLAVRTSQPRMGWCMCLNLVLLLFPSNLTPSYSIGPSCKTSATFLFVLFSFLPDLLRFQAFKSGFQTFFLFKNCATCTTVFILPIYMINLI